MSAFEPLLTNVVSLIVVLGVLVFVHELGHFLAAKWAGIYVHRFSVGLGAPIKALTTRRGETEYTISWLPLGGYVKMASAEEDVTSSALEGGRAEVQVPADRVFEAKPVWKRMVVILAGVTMNVLFAWLVFSFLSYKNGRQYDPTTTVGTVIEELVPPGADEIRKLRTGDRIVAVEGEPVQNWQDVQAGIATAQGASVEIALADGRRLSVPIHADAVVERDQLAQAVQPYQLAVVGQVVPGEPAEGAGIQVGDTVVSVAGQSIRQWYDLLERMGEYTGGEIAVVVGRPAGRTTLTMTPKMQEVPDTGGTTRRVGRIGIGPKTDVRSEPYTVGGALAAGWDATAAASTQIVRAVKGMLSGRVSGRTLGGPILIAQQAGQFARLGVDTFLGFMALISVNLAVLNMLPIPVLDGGQFLFLLAEAVIRRPLPLRLRERLTMVGLVLIVLLMVFAFSNDIRRLIGI